VNADRPRRGEYEHIYIASMAHNQSGAFGSSASARQRDEFMEGQPRGAYNGNYPVRAEKTQASLPKEV
jgi:hypothetical protein